MNRLGRFAAVALLAAALAAPAAAEVSIKMGTLAPEGSPWHDVLMEMRQRWSEISGGEVDLKIYPGGVQGDEYAMVRKMGFNRLQALAITGAGLSRIEPKANCLQVPLMFDSYDELDQVLAEMAPEFERLIEQQGYIVLSWGDAGWVHFFTSRPATTPDDLRRLKLLTSAGDPATEELYKDFGFQAVPLSYTDVLTSLQTGLIEAVQGPPLYALIQQWFGLAGNMLDIRWAALVGATVIRKDAWERIPAEWRGPMLAVAREAGARGRATIRKLGDDAIPEMAKRGLHIVAVRGEALARWHAEAREAYPLLKGSYCPAPLFDDILRHRDAYRERRRQSRSDSASPPGTP